MKIDGIYVRIEISKVRVDVLHLIAFIQIKH